MKKQLHSGWRLKRVGEEQSIEFSIPGDIHSALLSAGLIEDPYYRDNEFSLDWVHESEWEIEQQIELKEKDLEQALFLCLDQIDCHTTLFINGKALGETSNQFIRYVFDVSASLQPGINTIAIRFASNSEVANQKASDFPFELPYLSWNCRVPNNNFLRKTPCHSGWDWNICLMPLGAYGELSLLSSSSLFIEDSKIEQLEQGDDVELRLSAKVRVVEPGRYSSELTICGQRLEQAFELTTGLHELHWELLVESPARWWPAGHGEQHRHSLSLSLGDQYIETQIGFCSKRIVTEPDASGSGFHISVNGKPVFMRGANWIPADALPARIQPDAVRELLQSAVDANMNMLRVWGGGQYEPDWFYELCDELGILIWQDFMFSCNHYPAADANWLESVRTEAHQQTRRLSRFACVALWCGDNELVGALKWWDVTRENRDRYLANYARLNHTVEMAVNKEVADTDFWPSSPSVGFMDFGDGWKNDAAGDMHFWDVWHEAKPFSAYQDIHPRFCSEFGFQSFPSMPVVESFTEQSDRNVSSKVMEVHQRNVGGNARIVETLIRYFEFPDSFERIVFLSQCQQAMAIKTAVEYWRSLKPHCMGTLYWQLNDTWPVASWSSLEYGGGWKLLHYAAKRFYEPFHIAMVPGNKKFGTEGTLRLCVINDFNTDVSVAIALDAYNVDGVKLSSENINTSCEADAVTIVKTVDASLLDSNAEAVAFYRWQWHLIESAQQGNSSPAAGLVPGEETVFGENEYWLKPYKHFTLPAPNIRASFAKSNGEQHIELTTDKPAYFVSINLGSNQVLSDNGFTLMPGETKTLSVERELTHEAAPRSSSELTIQHL